jgi:hypothetical protein
MPKGIGQKIKLEQVDTETGIDQTQQFYHSHFLWFKIIKITFQTNTGEGNNMKRGVPQIQTTRLAREAPFISQLKIDLT